MMRVKVTCYHIFVIYLGLGLVVCLVGKDLNSQVQWMSIFPIPFTSKVIKYIQVTLTQATTPQANIDYWLHLKIPMLVTLTLGHNSASKCWLLTPLENSHVALLYIYSKNHSNHVLHHFSFFFFLFLNSEKMLKCHLQFYYKKNYSKMFTN